MNKALRTVLLVGGAVVAAALAGAYVSRNVSAVGQPGSRAAAQPRPIIQITRQQPGLPSLADLVAAICPSVAAIGSEGSDQLSTGVAISPDGWVIGSAAALPIGQLSVALGGAAPVPVTETRRDPVSGLAVFKSAATGLTPVTLADQIFPRVGDFGLLVGDPAASGCSAQLAMIASDFLVDGGAPAAYVRVQPMGSNLSPGAPVISAAGQLVGVAAAQGPVNALIPAPIVSDITDELLRDRLSPTVRFGFRAEDFDASLSSRLADSRSSGTAVALVQPKTPAARAGLRAGDIVIGVNGSPVASASELARALDGAGKSVSMDIARQDGRLTLTVRRVQGS